MEEKLNLKVEPNNQAIHTIVHHNSPIKEDSKCGMENTAIMNIVNNSNTTAAAIKKPGNRGAAVVNRKSSREKKTPLHLINSIVDMNAVGESLQQRICETNNNIANNNNASSQQPVVNKMLNKPKDLSRTNVYPNFKCDNCGSRYVVNPMRRGGSKVSTARNRATPRHKIDPQTQKVLTLCNACGLKLSRPRKIRANKEAMSEEEMKRFVEEGARFARELSEKLNNDIAVNLFCSNAKKTACGCIQKYLCGSEGSSVEEVVERAKDLLEICVEAIELKKKKCYATDAFETKPTGKKNAVKIGLGNGHRKSKEFEDFVLLKRKFLRNTLNFCEKATQKILSYSNNFLHKKMKTDPDKGIRVERQKGKAALGMLVPIEELSSEMCCVDNCVRMAMTHGRLLEVWRERATSGQVEARRVLAEMLTPSGGNRANCYRFVSLVTGCSHSTIGKVNEQMKSTGGDREPPEHGLKKYWKDKPKKEEPSPEPSNFIPPYQILETAASSAGLATMIECVPEPKASEPAMKKMRRQNNKTTKTTGKKGKAAGFPTNIQNTVNIVAENGSQVSTDLQNVQAVIAYPNGGYITIPAGLASSVQAVCASSVSLQALQEQQAVQQQQQQQLQMQIEMLQQQLQNSQAGNMTSLPAMNETTSEFVVNVTDTVDQGQVHLEQNNNNPVVMESTTVSEQQIGEMQSDNVAQPSYMHNVLAPSLVSNASNTQSVFPQSSTSYRAENMNFVSSGENISLIQQNSEAVNHNQNVSLIATSVTNQNNLNILTENNSPPATVKVITPENSMSETSVIGVCASAPMESLRQVHLITSQSPTMALNHPVTLSLQAQSTLPTMLLTQANSSEQQQQQQQQRHQQQLQKQGHQESQLQADNVSISHLPTMLLTQTTSNEQQASLPTTVFLTPSSSAEPRQASFQAPSISNIPTMVLTQSTSNDQQRQVTLQTPSITNLPTMLVTQSSTTDQQRQAPLQAPTITNLPTMLLTQSTCTDQQRLTSIPTPSITNLPTMLVTHSRASGQQPQVSLPIQNFTNLPTMLVTQSSPTSQQRQAPFQSQTVSNLPTMLLTQSNSQQRQTGQNQTIANLPTMVVPASNSCNKQQVTLQGPAVTNLPTMLVTQSSSGDQQRPTAQPPSIPTMILAQSSASDQQQVSLLSQTISSIPTMVLNQTPQEQNQSSGLKIPTVLLAQSTSNDTPQLEAPTMIFTGTANTVKEQPLNIQTSNLPLSTLPAMYLTQTNELRQATFQTQSISNVPTMLINPLTTANAQGQQSNLKLSSISDMPTMVINPSSLTEQQRQAPDVKLPTQVLLTQSLSNVPRQTSLQQPEGPSISLSNLPTMVLAQSSQGQTQANLPTMLLTQSATSQEQAATVPTTVLLSQPSQTTGEATLQPPTMSLPNLPTMLVTQPDTSREATQPSHTQQFIIQQQQTTSANQIMFRQQPLLSQPDNSQHLVVQPTLATMPSCTEQTAAVQSSVLSPMSSFNADAFLTSDSSMVKLPNNNGLMKLNKSNIVKLGNNNSVVKLSNNNGMVKLTNNNGEVVKLTNNNGVMKYTVMNTGSDIPRDSLIEEPSPQMPFIPPSVAAN